MSGVIRGGGHCAKFTELYFDRETAQVIWFSGSGRHAQRHVAATYQPGGTWASQHAKVIWDDEGGECTIRYEPPTNMLGFWATVDKAELQAVDSAHAAVAAPVYGQYY